MPSGLTVVLVSLLLALPVVVFWLWLVILPARTAILCPKECRCDIGGYYVKCGDTSLTAVPLIHLPDVRGLFLFRNKISLLVKDSFATVTELERLDIDSCGLRTIETGAFNGLRKLIRLVIRRNEICKILPRTFESMSSLEYLDLLRNRLEHVDKNTFSGLFNLKYVDLGDNNLQYVYPDTFLNLPNLQNLYLDGNPFHKIPTDRNFITSHSLSHLVISSVSISSVTVDTFANVSSLEYLDLSKNNLRTVDTNILRALPKLSTLYLQDNPLQCDCQLQEVWRWCEDRNIETRWVSLAPKCDTPRKVKGMSWGVLKKGQCLQGDIQYYADYKNYTDTKESYSYKSSDNSDFLKQYELPVYAVPFIFGTTSNVILLIIIICNKDMRTVSNMYILNLAISDIIYLTVLFSEACVNRMLERWYVDGDFMCAFITFCRRLSVCLSAYSVTVLSIQRYRVIVYPFHVRVSSKPTWRGTIATFLGVWIVAALFAVPSTLSKNRCVEDLRIPRVRYYQRVVIFELLASCAPLCVIALTYIMSARHLVESSPSRSEMTQNSHLKTRRNTANIVVGLTVVFLISYVPYHVFWTYIIWTQSNRAVFEDMNGYFSRSNSGMQYLISTGLLLINSCLNPVALFCTSSPFRQHLKRYLTCFCKTNSPLY